MVFYFSATGNSEFVAKEINREFGGSIIKISDALNRKEFEYKVRDGEKVFFVFPVYYFGLPDIVAHFLENVSFSGGKPDICGIATYGMNAGGVDRMFKHSLKKVAPEAIKGFYDVKMVDNNLLLMRMPLHEEQIMLLRRSQKRIKDIIDAIHYNYRACYESGIQNEIVSKLAYKVYLGNRSTRKFYASEKCIGCGLCQSVCPSKVISTEDGRPQWTKHTCSHCLACIQRCPAGAIQYGKLTAKRRRYYNPLLKK